MPFGGLVLARRRLTRLLGGVLCAAAWLAIAEAAQAGTVRKEGTRYVYSSDVPVAGSGVETAFCPAASPCPDEHDDAYLITDSGEPMTAAPGSGCQLRLGVMTCPAPGITSLEFALGGGNDTFRIHPCNVSAGGCGPYPAALVVHGESGADTISTGPQADVLSGGGESDTLNGGAGDDALVGGDAADTLNGQEGADAADYSDKARGVAVDLSTGRGGNAADGGLDVLGSVENVNGSPHADVLVGNGLVNRLDGAGGDDSIRGGGGNDTLVGGTGVRDVADYGERGAAESVTVNLAHPGPDGAAGEADTLSQFEGIAGGDGADRLVGGGAGDAIDGGGGNDSIDGLGGSDRVLAGDGDDTVESRDGGVFDDVDCGAGIDTANADGNDARSDCELPASPEGGGGGGPVAVTPTRIDVSLTFFFAATRTWTRLSRLRIRRVPAGARIQAACRTPRGKRCALTRDYSRRNVGAGVFRLRAFERKRMPRGAKLTIRITHPGNYVGQLKTVTMRSRRAPAIAERCLAAGSHRPAGC